MKPFNIFIIVALILIASGFIFFKDALLKTQSSKASTTANSEILMDRLNYLDYSGQNLLSAQRNGRTVLFFAATMWCQTCSELDKEIKERSQELPSDVTILKVDYNNNKVTKTKYNVTTQHTLIQVDSNGDEVKRWIGGYFDALVQNLQ